VGRTRSALAAFFGVWLADALAHYVGLPWLADMNRIALSQDALHAFLTAVGQSLAASLSVAVSVALALALSRIVRLKGRTIPLALWFPAAWLFFAGFSTDYVEFAPRIAPVFSMYVKMVLGLGAVFQMPTVVMFLARVGLVTPRFLLRHIKYAILIIFVVAALITPPDVVSQILIAGPMIVLYLFSVLVAWVFRKRSAPDVE
jgi:sec-independent protein translocase protein TatC